MAPPTAIEARDAQTHWPAVMERVAKGERFTITRDGAPVADLVPVGEKPKVKPSADQIVEELRKLRATIAPGGPTIRELIEEGRRY